MAKKTKKISKEELETLTELQKEVNNILAQIGNAEIVKSQLLDKHKSIHAMSGPCHITQLDDILSHPFVVILEFVGIINILFNYTVLIG